MFVQRLLDAGFSAEDVRTMAVTNPTRLVEE
jgi:predicted metal-dependent phosphotriesterase family hydrolase